MADKQTGLEKHWQGGTIPDLIIEVWEALDCESVGGRELEQIQDALRERFGDGAETSPATIARAVADEGAVLRHPEVFECDSKWRRRQLEHRGLNERLDFSDLSSAFASLVKIEQKRLQIQTQGGTGKKGNGERRDAVAVGELRALRELLMAARAEALLRASSKILDEGQRRQAQEVSEWLVVWLQAPELFSDWLDLRRRSPDFRKKFPDQEKD